MLKKLACIGLGVMIAITLGGCGRGNKINEHDKELVDSQKSFDEILIALFENEKEINDSNFFQTNSIHSETPGAWGDGMGELYYYSDDGYYLWNKSNYAYGEREVAKAGLWKIENGRLKLNELYTMYLDGGHFEETIGNGGEVIKDLVDYKIVIKDSDVVLDMKIENKGLSDYAKDIYGETKDDTYSLSNNKLWYSGTGAPITDMYWLNYYYTNEILTKDVEVVDLDKKKEYKHQSSNEEIDNKDIIKETTENNELNSFITSIVKNEVVYINSIQNYDAENYIVHATICEPYIMPKAENKMNNIVIDNRSHYLFEVQPGEYFENKVCNGVYKENINDNIGYYIQEDGKLIMDLTECTMVVYTVTSREVKFKLLKDGYVGYTHVDVPLQDVLKIGTNYSEAELGKLFVQDYSIYYPIFENDKCIGLSACNEGH